MRVLMSGSTLQRAIDRLTAWFRSLNPWLIDGIITAAFVLIGLASTSGLGAYDADQVNARDGLGVALALGVTLPYLFRRKAPLLVLVASGVALLAFVTTPYNEGVLPTVLICGLYTVGAWCPTRQAVAGMVFVLIVLLLVFVSDAPEFPVSALGVNLAVYLAAFFFGTSMRGRRQRMEALEQRAVALEHEQEEKQARVLADERLRIAHELHDVIAHSMGVIAVQAGVGAHVIDTQPGEAKKALLAISDVSRTTLGEIRRILAALRQEEGGAAHAPAPTLSDIDRLVTEMSGAGLDVEVAVDTSGAEVGDLPHGVELTAFRIVQEALTNVLKHAGPARATVCIGHRPGVLDLTITDDGRGVNARSSGGGHGLVGMRERVAAYGGTFSAGPRAGGGFQVRATLPYEVLA